MQEFLPILRECPLFWGLQEDELLSMLQCLDGRIQNVEKGITVFREGDTARWVGVVLSGAVQVLREDYFGNRSVLSVLEEGELFGEVFACAEIEELPVSVCTIKESKILLLDCQRVLTTCSNACRFHSRLIRNLLQAVARKNLQLNQKISIMSKRTTREKLMAYLLEQAKQYQIQ